MLLNEHTSAPPLQPDDDEERAARVKALQKWRGITDDEPDKED
jgi:hypothetical protein